MQRLADSYHELAQLPFGIVDSDTHELVVSSGWSEICSAFHRPTPLTCKRCQEADSNIQMRIRSGSHEPLAYKCGNGLWDIAIPVFIEQRHLASIIFGQFLYDDEPIDRDFFRAQAKACGFDEHAYMRALDDAPVISRAKTKAIISFAQSLASFMEDAIATKALLSTEAAYRRHVEIASAERERVAKSLYSAMQEGFCMHELICDKTGKPSNYRIIEINSAYEEILHKSRSEVVGKLITEVFGIAEAPYLETYARVAIEGKNEQLEAFFPHLNAHFQISAFSPGKGFFATVFSNITEHKENARLVSLQRDLGIALGSADTLPAALDCILECTCQLPGIDCGVLYSIAPESDRKSVV